MSFDKIKFGYVKLPIVASDKNELGKKPKFTVSELLGELPLDYFYDNGSEDDCNCGEFDCIHIKKGVYVSRLDVFLKTQIECLIEEDVSFLRISSHLKPESESVTTLSDEEAEFFFDLRLKLFSEEVMKKTESLIYECEQKLLKEGSFSYQYAPLLVDVSIVGTTLGTFSYFYAPVLIDIFVKGTPLAEYFVNYKIEIDVSVVGTNPPVTKLIDGNIKLSPLPYLKFSSLNFNCPVSKFPGLKTTRCSRDFVGRGFVPDLCEKDMSITASRESSLYFQDRYCVG